VFLTLYLAKTLQNKRDAAGDYARLIVAGYTLSHLEKTFLIYFRQYLIQSKTPYTENKKFNTFLIGTVTIMLLPMENPDDIFGEDAFACVVEELDELTEDKSFEAVKALSERCRQQIIGFREPFLCFGSTSQGQKGLYRIYVSFKKSGVGFVLIRGRTEDNPYLPKSQIRDMKRMYTPEEQEVFMNGKFMAIAKGRVLGDFDWQRNFVKFDLDTSAAPGETIYVGMDFNTGFNRATAYRLIDGVLYCVKYYDFPNPQDAPEVFRHDFPEQRILWLPDVTIKDSFPQFGRALRKYDIHIIYRKKSPLVEDTCFLVNKLFRMERLMICKIAAPLAEACAMAGRDKDNKIPKGSGPSSPMHAIDGLRYVCAFVAANKKEFRDIRKLIMDKRASLRQDQEEMVRRLNGGYTELNPSVVA
jgi:hypothetical protein